MGARGKKRVRANGQIASGKQERAPGIPIAVPEVESRQVSEGLEELSVALRRHGDPADRKGPKWNAAYVEAQKVLRDRYPAMLADRILWRATFLEALISSGNFQQRHSGSGDLPTPQMLHVAATITTYGFDTSFDIGLFEASLATAPASS